MGRCSRRPLHLAFQFRGALRFGSLGLYLSKQAGPAWRGCAGIIAMRGFAMLSWREWKALGEHGPTSEGGAFARGTFMAIGGLALSLACFVIVLAQTIPQLVLGACE